MNALHLYRRAQSLGLHLEADGGSLLVRPRSKCPPDFVGVLRAHKGELLAWLQSQSAGLAPDCVPWLHIAKQILAGEWDGADRSTVKSLTIGLRSIEHPICRKALERLKGKT